MADSGKEKAPDEISRAPLQKLRSLFTLLLFHALERSTKNITTLSASDATNIAQAKLFRKCLLLSCSRTSAFHK